MCPCLVDCLIDWELQGLIGSKLQSAERDNNSIAEKLRSQLQHGIDHSYDIPKYSHVFPIQVNSSVLHYLTLLFSGSTPLCSSRLADRVLQCRTSPWRAWLCVNAGSYGYQIINGYGLRIKTWQTIICLSMFGIKYWPYNYSWGTQFWSFLIHSLMLIHYNILHNPKPHVWVQAQLISSSHEVSTLSQCSRRSTSANCMTLDPAIHQPSGPSIILHH